MNSPVLGTGFDDFFTKNTRATLKKTIPNGTYYWRVRASNAADEVSKWTEPRSFRKLWNLQPAIQSPGSGAAHAPAPAASAPTLGSLVLHYVNQDDPKGPPNVAATSAAITSALAPGPDYWNVMPVDAGGNRGAS